ncbi:MAG: peptidylprolyl isomerase, partial [Planctomycetes bacterium]|nr:peptidylprolyl isomerase [Planctomycetota bacterium]
AAEGSAEAADAIARELRETKSQSVRRAALMTLGRGAKERSLPELRAALGDGAALVRAAAAAGLGYAGEGALPDLARALEDADPRVRAAAVEALAEIGGQAAWEQIAVRAARDLDCGVRWSVADRLAAKKPPDWKESLAALFADSQDPASWDVRVTILNALREDAAAVLPLAERALADGAFSVRRLAREIAGGGAAPAGERSPAPRLPYPLLRREEFYGGAPPHLFLETDAGRVVIELYLDEAPHHVSSIVALARQGFYDGLTFHRVVPSFVAQGGDPRADGNGDAGYFLPDEINRIPYLRGTVGMPKSTKDDGGCQIFVAHLPLPRLDGRYTVFGRVVLGMDAIDRMEVGSVIRRAWVDEFAYRPAAQLAR